jgi:hypothetical protein
VPTVGEVRDSRSDALDHFLVPLIIKNHFLFSTTKTNFIFNSLERTKRRRWGPKNFIDFKNRRPKSWLKHIKWNWFVHLSIKDPFFCWKVKEEWNGVVKKLGQPEWASARVMVLTVRELSERFQIWRGRSFSCSFDYKKSFLVLYNKEQLHFQLIRKRRKRIVKLRMVEMTKKNCKGRVGRWWSYDDDWWASNGNDGYGKVSRLGHKVCVCWWWRIWDFFSSLFYFYFVFILIESALYFLIH